MGLRPIEFTILQLAHENPSASPTNLARAPRITVPGVKLWLDRLEKRKRGQEVLAPARDNHVPAAHLVAVLRQHGVVELRTHGRDFRRFDFLQVVDPLV